MSLKSFYPGKDFPRKFYVVIEIPAGSSVKYEYCKESGQICVDRILQVSMSYPTNYGFIPGTLSKDGDPTDVLLFASKDLAPGVVVEARPIGVLNMKDESGQDEKIIALPVEKVDPYFADIKTLDGMPLILRDKISHFFNRYKDLEKGKWVEIQDWGSVEDAMQILKNSAI